eukprot:TRINITY_DN6674_c0_g1_i2.p2 TRINITY_DN6674_c0_g1~~TRINITY_DN6674_c0_g1_i2.p2  ORF type:complete len:109 (-),score=25.81 TRINITY_DN6674_c0_g1_i2:581-907(-)
MNYFNIEMRENHRVTEVTFTQKVPEMGVTVTKKEVNLGSMKEIQKIAEVVSMCYHIEDVTYSSNHLRVCRSKEELLEEIQKENFFLLAPSLTTIDLKVNEFEGDPIRK